MRRCAGGAIYHLGKRALSRRQSSKQPACLQGGALKAGTQVVVVPSGQSGTVKAAEAGGAALPFACAGDSVDLALIGVDTQAR